MQIPQIEPFQFIRSTAFSERVQLANKINEIIEGINSIGEIPDIQAEIDAVKGTISQIQTDLADTNSDVSGLTNQVNTLISEVNGLLKEVISEISLDSPGYGQVRVKVIHEDETETASNALQIPVIVDGGISLISGTTARSFKIRYITADGVTHTTNDFVIPEGGGTDVTVTSISILQGDTANDIKFQVGLSDGSMIQSNSYPIPQAAITPATTSQIGGIKVGTNLSVTADGTLSVDMTTIGTAAAASTMFFTGDASKVTMHADSLLGSEFTEDLPQASTGGAGTIDAAAYQKLSNVPDPSTIATDSEISDLQGQITGLKLSKPDSNQIQLNGDNVTVVESVSGTVDDDGNLVITINGVSGSGIPLPEIIKLKTHLYTSTSTHPVAGNSGSNNDYAESLVPLTDSKFYIPSNIGTIIENVSPLGNVTNSIATILRITDAPSIATIMNGISTEWSKLEDGTYSLFLAVNTGTSNNYGILYIGQGTNLSTLTIQGGNVTFPTTLFLASNRTLQATPTPLPSGSVFNLCKIYKSA